MGKKPPISENTLFTERLYDAYLPGGRITYHKLLLGAYALRATSILLMGLMMASILFEQLTPQGFDTSFIVVDIAMLLAIILMIIYGEYVYINGGLSSRPLKLYENGLEIPPLYFRKFIKDSGFIRKEEIEYIELKRHRSFSITYSRGAGVVWRSSPIEFIVHLKNGSKRSSGKRPFEVIHYAVNDMNNRWGMRVVDNGIGNGQRVTFKDGKIVEWIEM